MESTAVSYAHSAPSNYTIVFRTIIANCTAWLESELYTILALAFTCIFYDGDPTKSFPLRQATRNLSQQLSKLVEFNVQCVNTTGFVATVLDRLHKHDALTDYGVHLVRTLLANDGMTVKEIAHTHITPTAACMVANQSQLFSQCLDYYLSDQGKQHIPEIHRLANLNTAEADNILQH
jgi:linoleate 8R-lipoxygenase / 9,12-octadecadienoate 8-hydroperoxide 8R-isomerase